MENRPKRDVWSRQLSNEVGSHPRHHLIYICTWFLAAAAAVHMHMYPLTLHNSSFPNYQISQISNSQIPWPNPTPSQNLNSMIGEFKTSPPPRPGRAGPGPLGALHTLSYHITGAYCNCIYHYMRFGVWGLGFEGWFT